MGHSYGTLLGINYVVSQPERVLCYVGIGQTISITDTQEANYNEIVAQNPKKNKLITAYKSFKACPCLKHLSSFQKLSLQYFSKKIKLEQRNPLKIILSSPDLTWRDLRWFFGMLSFKKHYNRNKKLLDYTLSANTYSAGKEFSVPMFFISGEFDKHCNVALVKKYSETITAPIKDMIIMEKCGHSPQIDNPKETAHEVKKLILRI